MKVINGKEYYKMSELSEITELSKSTIQYYKDIGLIPNPINTSKNMSYYPIVTKSVLDLIKYLIKEMNYSVIHISEIFKEYKIEFNSKEEIVLQIIELITFNKKNFSIKIDDIETLNKIIELGIFEKRELYSNKEYEIFNIFKEIFKYEESTTLVESYLLHAKEISKLEKLLADKVFEKEKELSEVLVLDVLTKLKPFILNKSLLDEYKK